METLRVMNYVISVIFTICYFYQFLYVPISWIVKKKENRVDKKNRFAVLICARNEEKVIGDLVDSIKIQTYPRELIDIYVMADNCTDKTALVAKEHGAMVYTRFNKELVGKGYALNVLIHNIWKYSKKKYDGYFVFDADNILRRDYIEKMNDTFNGGNEIITGYRNTKNYGDNWISAGYGLWFLRESRYLHMPRYLINASGNVSGTGFLFSDRIAKENDGWPFHLLTEDIEFSIDAITKGNKVAFCREAELFDEQPTDFMASIHQRLRWSKGYLQVLNKYGLQLFKGIFKGSFSCYDMFMNNIPAFVLSTISLVCNFSIAIILAIEGNDVSVGIMSFFEMTRNVYLMLFVLGFITTITEWKHIYTKWYKKIIYTLTFPLFMFTYIPISMAAFFCNVTWKPIEHKVSINDLRRSGLREDATIK